MEYNYYFRPIICTDQERAEMGKVKNYYWDRLMEYNDQEADVTPSIQKVPKAPQYVYRATIKDPETGRLREVEVIGANMLRALEGTEFQNVIEVVLLRGVE